MDGIKGPSSRPACGLGRGMKKKRAARQGQAGGPGRPTRVRIESYARNLLMR